MITALLADGFEEIEALMQIDLLRRAGLDVKTVAVGSKIAVGSHGIPVICDLSKDELSLDSVSMVILPGGMPGALNLDASDFVDKTVRSVLARGGRVAAICAAPLILGRRGLLDGKRATCYPGFENELSRATVVDAPVVTDGLITTANGMGAAHLLARELLTLTVGKSRADEILTSAMFSEI